MQVLRTCDNMNTRTLLVQHSYQTNSYDSSPCKGVLFIAKNHCFSTFALLMRHALHYSHPVLDRNPVYRKESLENLLSHPEGKVLVLRQDKNLFDLSNESIEIVFLPTSKFASKHNWIYLGHHQKAPLFGFDCSIEESASLTWLRPEHSFEELRSHVTSIPSELASLLAYARGMSIWHRNHRFCGACGAPTEPVLNGHELKCSNTGCSKIIYPRVDPAVIVLITHTFPDGTEKCLLGRSGKYSANMFSTLAGFVEPGESLEMTVKREMMEEVGLEVKNIRYIASQPWPFPTSLMLGFYAEAVHTNITLEEDEILEARWFSRQELRELSVSGEILLSRVDSIARFLIEGWMNQKEQ